MKIFNNEQYEFRCDRCGDLLAAHEDEQEALSQARRQADIRGWVFFYPGWKFLCKQCNKFGGGNLARQKM